MEILKNLQVSHKRIDGMDRIMMNRIIAQRAQINQKENALKRTKVDDYVDVKNMSLESILAKYKFSEENQVKIRMMREKERRIEEKRSMLRSNLQQKEKGMYDLREFDSVDFSGKEAKFLDSEHLDSTTACRSHSLSKENHDDSVEIVKLNLNQTL